MVEDKIYDSFTGLLNGSQVHTLRDNFLIAEVQAKTCELLKDSADIYVLHDPCDIRKPSCFEMEAIGKVMSLDKKVINGYKTFNSVAIDLHKQGVHLLCHQTYSNEVVNFISQEAIRTKTYPIEKQALVDKQAYINGTVLYKEKVKESSEILKKSNPTAHICHISDREFDNNDFFEHIVVQGDDFITRMKLSRLSNEILPYFTPKGNISKKIVYQKVLDKKFKNKEILLIDKLAIKGKLHQNVSCCLEWEALVIEGKNYNVVRVSLFCEGKALFQHPMLLLTNKEISNGEQAKAIYKGYILRFKIEVVFKFLKQNLGWESFQVRSFETIKNLLAIAFFLVGYFKELEEELKTHPLALLLCKLGISKGKVTIFYLLQGLAKLVHFQEVELWKIENNISNDDISEFMAKFKNQN